MSASNQRTTRTSAIIANIPAWYRKVQLRPVARAIAQSSSSSLPWITQNTARVKVSETFDE